MSPLLTDRIRIYLHPQHLTMVRVSGWLKAKVVVKAVLSGWEPCPDYSHALNTLSQQFKKVEWQRAKASVILSGHGVHYRVAPWHADLTNDEQEALLRHRYSEVFGTKAASWKISFCDAGFAKQGLAVAIDHVLLDQIKVIFTTSTLRLDVIEPSLMVALNASRKQLNTENTWFILLEAGLLTAGLLNEQGWAGIRSISFSAERLANIEIQLKNWAMQFGVEDKQSPVFVFSADSVFDLSKLGNRKVVCFEGRGKDSLEDIDQASALVLCV